MTHSGQLAAQRKVLVEEVELFDNEVRTFSLQLAQEDFQETVPDILQTFLAMRRSALLCAEERLVNFDQRSWVHHSLVDTRS